MRKSLPRPRAGSEILGDVPFATFHLNACPAVFDDNFSTVQNGSMYIRAPCVVRDAGMNAAVCLADQHPILPS